MNKESIRFNGYMIRNFHLEKDDNIPKEEQNSLNVRCSSYQKNDKGKTATYQVEIDVITYTKKSKINLVFDGFFEIPDSVDDEIKEYFLRVSAPAIIYPYARTFISNVTSFDADETVVLPIINFAEQE